MSNLQGPAQVLEARMTEFSFRIVQLSRKAPKDLENNIILDQLVRAATSIGANYTEANNASSKQDFRNKVFIAKKEAAETRYWLRILKSSGQELPIDNLLAEVTQFLMILQKIVTTLKHGK